MITFPPEFTAIRYPGYFWHMTEQRLYTMKVTGVLRPLTLYKANRWNHGKDGYKLSVDGRKRYVWLSSLAKTKQKDSVVPVQLTLF